MDSVGVVAHPVAQCDRAVPELTRDGVLTPVASQGVVVESDLVVDRDGCSERKAPQVLDEA